MAILSKTAEGFKNELEVDQITLNLVTKLPNLQQYEFQ